MKYYWIGHCKEGTSDKVWGLIQLTVDNEGFGYSTGNYVAVWGRRGKKLQTKLHKDISKWDASRLCSKKQSGGYQQIETFEQVYPEFEQDLQQTAVWAMLSS